MEDINSEIRKNYREIDAPLIGLKKSTSRSSSCCHAFNCAGNEISAFSCFVFLRLDTISKRRGPEIRIVWSYPLSSLLVSQKYPNLGKFIFTDRSLLDTSLELGSTFVLTDGSGVRTYGHCSNFVNEEAVVILSPYPWCIFFSRLANLFRSNGIEGKRVVQALHQCATPPSGAPFLVPLDLGIAFTRPYDRLCAFVDTSPSMILRVFDTSTLFNVLADLLLEKHIIVVGPSFSVVSTTIMSLLALVAPFEWVHILIPVLPSSLIHVLGAPPPYLVGILTSQLALLQDVVIDSAVMIYLNKSGKCEKVSHIQETKDTLPFSQSFSALRVGLGILRLRVSMEYTARDLCSLFLSYYATLFGKIVLRGAKAYVKEEPGARPSYNFFQRLVSTQSFSVLSSEVEDIMSRDNVDWLDNEFIVATVRANQNVFPDHYDVLVREEEQGGGYIQRYNECFGSSEDFTSWTAAVHGFGGHSVGLPRLISHYLVSFIPCLRTQNSGLQREVLITLV